MSGDRASAEHRSWIMAQVKGADTTPERLVRRLARKLGLRFQANREDLPGSPDLAFRARRAAVFVHGCFWHGHSCRRGDRLPKTNRAYWRAKIAGNVRRDRKMRQALRELGWRMLVLWECRLGDPRKCATRLDAFVRKAATARPRKLRA